MSAVNLSDKSVLDSRLVPSDNTDNTQIMTSEENPLHREITDLTTAPSQHVEVIPTVLTHLVNEFNPTQEIQIDFNQSPKVLNQQAAELAEAVGRIYHMFLEDTDNFPSEELNKAISSLDAIEKIGGHLAIQDSLAQEPNKILDEASTLKVFVNEMNHNAVGLTKQDAKNFASFITPPSQQFYIDEETGVQYYEADHSQLLTIGSSFCQENEFKSTSLLRKITLPHPNTNKPHVCDILAFRKKEDQIKFESSSKNQNIESDETSSNSTSPFSCVFSAWGGGGSSKISDRIEMQHTNSQSFHQLIKEHLAAWNYESFYLADSRELIQKFGYSNEQALQCNAIILFLKQVDPLY